LIALPNIKHNLSLAQERMNKNVDKRRLERQIAVGDMAYLKMQAYRHTSLGIHISLKLHSRYYEPFKVLQRIGQVAYTLLLHENCNIHPVFHISQLKKHVGSKVIPRAIYP
jgi:hypothetical protein